LERLLKLLEFYKLCVQDVKLRFITGHFMSSLTYKESIQEHQEEINQAGQLHAQ